jgi:hypothetical protein
VTRADLPPGVQACQAVHAALAFALAHPALTRDWHRCSNTLVLLAASPCALTQLRSDAEAAGRRMISFYEPAWSATFHSLSRDGRR